MLSTALARARIAAGALAIAGVLAGCVSAPTTTAKVQVHTDVIDAMHRFELVYRIQPGDQLDIFLNKHQDYSRKVTVRPDGFISLPLIDDEIQVVGTPPKELADKLKALYEKRLLKPEVTVSVLNPPEPMVYVVGSVGAPHALPLRQAATVAQAIAQSGDASKTSALNDIQVIRLDPQGYLEATTVSSDINLSQPEAYMAMAAMTLRPNDIILVPESYRGQLVRDLQDVSTAVAPLINVLLLREIYKYH